MERTFRRYAGQAPAVLVVYQDRGPGGPCGQSMSVTCPHTYFFAYDSEEAFRSDPRVQSGESLVKTFGRNSKQARVEVFRATDDFDRGGPVRWEYVRNPTHPEG